MESLPDKIHLGPGLVHGDSVPRRGERGNTAREDRHIISGWRLRGRVRAYTGNIRKLAFPPVMK
jgi:hypothetical protein